MWPWRVKMPTQNLLRLLLLLMLMMRSVLATVCCRFGSWGLVIKLNFCSDFEHFGQNFELEVQGRFWNWSLVEVMKLNLGQYFEARFAQDFYLRFSRDADVLLKFWSWCLVEILKMNFDKDLYDSHFLRNKWMEAQTKEFIAERSHDQLSRVILSKPYWRPHPLGVEDTLHNILIVLWYFNAKVFSHCW